MPSLSVSAFSGNGTEITQTTQSEVNPNSITDLGQYSEQHLQGLDDCKRYWFLQQPYRPSTQYKFPVKVEYGKSRSFQHSWLREYTWLSYTPVQKWGNLHNLCSIC